MRDTFFDALRSLGRAGREAALGARRRPLLPLAAFGALTVCLTLSGLFGLLAWNAARLTRSWSGGGQMTVYLDEDISPDRANQLTLAIRHFPGVTGARLVESKEAYERLRSALATRSDLLDGVETSFLPTSIDVRLVPGTAPLLRAHPAYQKLLSAAGVEDIDLHAESVEHMNTLRSLVLRGAWLFGLLAALATIYLVSATIRIGVSARRDELSVLRLVGATESFVRAPFLFEGLMTGLLGAIVSVAIVAATWHAFAPRLAAGLGDWLASAPLSFYPLPVLLGGLLGGALLGLVGARAAFTGAARA
ncbi:MAG: permease-like cell division protein FtsX [Polyangia bacterium]